MDGNQGHPDKADDSEGAAIDEDEDGGQDVEGGEETEDNEPEQRAEYCTVQNKS